MWQVAFVRAVLRQWQPGLLRAAGSAQVRRFWLWFVMVVVVVVVVVLLLLLLLLLAFVRCCRCRCCLLMLCFSVLFLYFLYCCDAHQTTGSRAVVPCGGAARAHAGRVVVP